MLIQTRGATARYFTQHDHGLHVGALARGLSPGLSSTSAHAIASHDLAWEPLDDLTNGRFAFDVERGALRDFARVPIARRLEMYSAGLDALEPHHAYAALLGSMHYALFFPRGPSNATFHATEDARRRRLHASLGLSAADADLRADYDLLQLLDTISLFACLRAPGADPDGAPGWLNGRARHRDEVHVCAWTGPDELSVRGLGEALEVTYELPYRELPVRFEDAEALRSAWRGAPLRRWRLTVRGC